MNQQGAEFGGFAGQHARGQCIQGSGQHGLAFGTIDRGVGSGVDDDVGTQGAHGGGQIIEAAQIATVFGAVAIQGRDASQRGQAALQLPAQLAAFAEQQDVHAHAALSLAYCFCTQSR